MQIGHFRDMIYGEDVKDLAIEMTEVGKRLGSHWILAHLNLRINRGESTALFGRNGSGKSTLLKILATLLAPTTGRLKIAGMDSQDDKSHVRKKIRLLGHDKQLYQTLTVMENLRLAATIRGLKSLTPANYAQILEKLQLTRYRDRLLRELSEGMKKRCVLAKLLLGEPELILLDEPHPTLDTEGKAILNEMIVEWKRQGKTIVLASHDHEQALAYADRLLVLEDGEIAYDGPKGGYTR